MNKPINCRKFFLVVGIILVSAALIFRGYVEYQKRVHNLNLQIGHSLYPVVSDYFSWSKEEPLKPGELPKRGEFYSYRRPESATKTLMEKFYQWLSGGRVATKQCHGVSEDGLLWDTGSDDKWVPATDIVGHVVEIYDSRYKELSKTPEGRFRLWVERHHMKEDYLQDGPYIALLEVDSTVVYRDGAPIATIRGYRPHAVANSRFVLSKNINEVQSAYTLYDPNKQLVVKGVDRMGMSVPLNPKPIESEAYTAEGGVCFALDNDSETNWVINSASPRVSTSKIIFLKPAPFTRLHIEGYADATVTLRVIVDGRFIANPTALELVGFNTVLPAEYKKVVLEFERQPGSAEEFEGCISAVRFN